MAKRKADIFTVAESVTNWFEASSHNITTTYTTEVNANRSEFGGTEACKSNVAEIAAHGIEASQHVLTTSHVTGEATNWSGSTQEGEESAGGASPRGKDEVNEPGHC